MRWPVFAVGIYVLLCLTVLVMAFAGALAFSSLFLVTLPWSFFLLGAFQTGLFFGVAFFLAGMVVNIGVFLLLMRALRQV